MLPHTAAFQSPLLPMAKMKVIKRSMQLEDEFSRLQEWMAQMYPAAKVVKEAEELSGLDDAIAQE